MKSILMWAGLPQEEALRVRLWHLKKCAVGHLRRVLKKSYDEITKWSGHKLGGVTQLSYRGRVAMISPWSRHRTASA